MGSDALRSPASALLRRKRVLIVVAVLPLIFLFFFLSLQEPVCVGDCTSYTPLMGLVPWQTAYRFQLRYTFRGWTVPVFYSLFGRYGVASAQGIVIVQALLLFVATVVFAAAVASRFAPRRRVWVAVLLATMLAFQQGYLLFSGLLLSDALAWALLLLLLSMVVASSSLLGQFGYTRFAWTYLVLGWMAIGARDANQQVLLVVTAYLLFICRLRLTRKEIAGLAAGVLFLCFVQAHGASVRFRVNMENVLIARILPDPEARGFFLRHGMPLAYAELGKSLPLLPLEAVDANVVNRGRTALELLGTQYVRSAPRTYALWLLTHPVRTVRTIYQERAFVFSDDFLWLDSSRLQLASVARRLETGNELETRPATPYFAVRHRLLELRPSVMERTPLALRLGLFVLLTTWGLWRNAQAFLSSVGGFAVVLGLAGLLNATSGFLADAWQLNEMERHAGIGNMLFNTGTLVLLLWAVQESAIRSSGYTRTHGGSGRTGTTLYKG